MSPQRRIVFVHGYLGSALNWARVQSVFEDKGYRCQSVDLLWHIGNPAREKPVISGLALDQMHDDLKAQVGDEAAIFVAHSFGIRPLLLLADREPEMVQGMIIEDSMPELSSGGFAFLKRILAETPVPFKSRDLARKYMEENFEDRSMQLFLQSQIRRLNEGEHTWAFNHECLLELLEESKERPLWDEWQRFQGPVQLILGGRSETVPEVALKRALSLRSDSVTEVEIVEDSGHWVHFEQFEAFVLAMQKGLKLIDGS